MVMGRSTLDQDAWGDAASYVLLGASQWLAQTKSGKTLFGVPG